MMGLSHVHAEPMVSVLARHPDEFRLVAYWDPNDEVAADRGRHWSDSLAGARRFGSKEELFRQPIDAVIVEGQVEANLETAKDAIAAGFPVLLEKPAGTRYADFEQLVDQAARRGLRLQMLYLFRYLSAVRRLIEMVERGELGRIYHFRGRLPKERANYKTYAAELGQFAGGIFFEMAGHLIDLAIRLLGPPRQIHSWMAHHHPVPGTFVDNGLAVLEFPRAFASIEVPALEAVPHLRRIEVLGEAGGCIIPNLGSGHLANQPTQAIQTFRAGDRDWCREELPAAELRLADLREFAATLAGAKHPDYSSEHDLRVQETLLRASGMW